MLAVRYRNLRALRILLENGSDPNFTTKYDTTALHIAVYYRSYESIFDLLYFGAEPNQQSTGGNTCLHILYDDFVFTEVNPCYSIIINTGIAK